MMEDSPAGQQFKGLEPLKDAPIAPAHGIAALALNMALQYHDLAIVKDGAMYQQYKIEGRNMREIQLADVFETAIKMERYLLASSERIAGIVVDALEASVERDINAPPGEG